MTHTTRGQQEARQLDPPQAALLPLLGMGLAQIGNLHREVSDDVAAAAVATAWDGGIRYFDTAPHYGLGLSEQRAGRALSGYPRAEYYLSTKVGRVLEASPETAHRQDDEGFHVPAAYRRVFDFSRSGILRSLEGSLTRLGVDRLDVVYLHDPDQHWLAASTTGMNTLAQLRDEKVIGAMGVGMNQTQLLAEFVRRCDVDVVMVAGRYTLLDQSALNELLPLATERHVHVVAAAPYNSGLLSSQQVEDDAHYDYVSASQNLVTRSACHCSSMRKLRSSATGSGDAVSPPACRGRYRGRGHAQP